MSVVETILGISVCVRVVVVLLMCRADAVWIDVLEVKFRAGCFIAAGNFAGSLA